MGDDVGMFPFRKTVLLADDDENFDADDEFELRMQTSEGTGWDTAIVVHSANLNVKVVNATKAMVYWRTSYGSGMYHGYYSAGAAYDTTVRTLFEPTKFNDGTKWYVETTAKQTGTIPGGLARMYLYDGYDSDMNWPQIHGTAGVVTPTTGDIPPDSNNDWYDCNYQSLAGEGEGGPILEGSNVRTWVIADIALENYDITLEEFALDGDLPVDAIINEVKVWMVTGAYPQGAAFTVTLYNNLTNQAEVVFNRPASSYIGGSIILGGVWYEDTTPTDPWTRALLLDGTLTARIRVTQPNNTTPTYYIIDYFAIYVGYGENIVEFNHSTAARERLRSIDVTSTLVDNKRYITHYYAPNTNNMIIQNAMTFLVAEISV